MDFKGFSSPRWAAFASQAYVCISVGYCSRFPFQGLAQAPFQSRSAKGCCGLTMSEMKFNCGEFPDFTRSGNNSALRRVQVALDRSV